VFQHRHPLDVVIRVPTVARSAQASAKETPKDCWILHERERHHHWKGVGQLSIKSFFGGCAHYQVGSGRYAIDETSYLLLNDGQVYAIDIESRQPVESFCLFFTPGFVEDVLRNFSCKTRALLDEPELDRTPPVRFFEKNYAHDRILSPALFRLRESYRNGDSGSIVESLHGIAERLLRVHQVTRSESNRLDSVRPATREELYRRVCRARDYAYATFGEPITLTELASVACLSPNHLLRSFRQVFSQTPHQYLTERRLQEARRLLCQSDLPVTEICLAVGFESLGSFSTLFRKRFAISPSECRRQKR
jgi:AraC family transcriptional regulator